MERKKKQENADLTKGQLLDMLMERRNEIDAQKDKIRAEIKRLNTEKQIPIEKEVNMTTLLNGSIFDEVPKVDVVAIDNKINKYTKALEIPYSQDTRYKELVLQYMDILQAEYEPKYKEAQDYLTKIINELEEAQKGPGIVDDCINNDVQCLGLSLEIVGIQYGTNGIDLINRVRREMNRA